MNDVMCKGDYRLGTACGKCSRCVAAEGLRPENQRVYPIGAQRDWQAELDAQRLRADTAEAELEVLRQQHAEQSCIFCNNSGELLSAVKTERSRGDAAVGDANEAERRLAAAEQRILELEVLLRCCIPTLEYMKCNVLVGMINAALNQKSEGESHE